MDLGIRDKRAAVAAGSAGPGPGTAKALVEAGVRVAICGRSRERLDAAVAELGKKAIGLVADVISGNRKLIEDLLYRIRTMELARQGETPVRPSSSARQGP